MAKFGAHVNDVALLENLEKLIVDSGKTMANIDQAVVNHINNVRKTLERQLDSVKEKLQEAEQKLSDAENALSSCKASQVLDPETGTFVPSCDCEESAVESAQAEMEKWRAKYERGQQILRECQQEIADYSSGGHTLVVNMSERQTPKASQLLRNCIGKLQDILNINMVINANEDVGTAPEGQVRPLMNEDRANDLESLFKL